ncbi:MAG TPA: glycosyltransferase family 87 protein [Acetobacteraceae bacterium]|nr:glycosyltransferase family 87 protein [Acetobacteraceae bacterium]
MSHPARAASGATLLRPAAWTIRRRIALIVVAVLAIPGAFFTCVMGDMIVKEFTGSFSLHAYQLYLFWTWSKFLHEHAASLIYHPHLLYAFDQTHFPPWPFDLPFAYPPSILLLIWPLAAASPITGTLVWVVIGLAAFMWASWQRGRGALWSTATVAFAAIAPSTLAALDWGQVSLLVSALLIGGWRLIDRRPILSGVLFGLASIKPQLGILVPVALVSAGYWRTTVSATVTVGLTILASGLAFGWSNWTGLPAALLSLSHVIGATSGFDGNCPTMTAALRMIGAGTFITTAGQAVTTIGAAVSVWLAFRGGVTPLAVALLMAGTFLATPYAVFYDLPTLSYAVALMVTERYDNKGDLTYLELAVVLLSVALPLLIIFRTWNAPWGAIVPVALFLTILRAIAVRRLRPSFRCPAAVA